VEGTAKYAETALTALAILLQLIAELKA